MSDTRAQLVLPPESDKVVAFDDAARIVASLDAAIREATLDQLKELIRLLVSRVTTADRAIASIEIVPAARPSSRRFRLCLLRPRTDSGAR